MPIDKILVVMNAERRFAGVVRAAVSAQGRVSGLTAAASARFGRDVAKRFRELVGPAARTRAGEVRLSLEAEGEHLQARLGIAGRGRSAVCRAPRSPRASGGRKGAVTV